MTRFVNPSRPTASYPCLDHPATSGPRACHRCGGTNQTPGRIEVRFPAMPNTQAWGGTGYDWMDELTGWEVLSGWGRDGYDLGQWPYQILAICPPQLASDHTTIGMATYTEGDITVDAFRSYPELEEAIGRYAFDIWTHTGGGPTPLPERYEDLAQEYREPYGGRPLVAASPT